MDEAEKQAIRRRLVELGVDAPRAVTWSVQFGEQCEASGANLQTLLLFALSVAAGCRSGLPADLAREVEELHNKVDAETDREANEARS